MQRQALRWLEGLCLGTPLLVALGAAWAWQSGAELDWRSEAGAVALLLPALGLLWWAARATTLHGTARALTWTGWVLVGQAFLSLGLGAADMTETLPGASPVVLALSGGLGTFLSLLPGLGLLALAAVMRQVADLLQDEELTV
ncbi:hypothetical protein [Deinococcus budaensis]|uniref:DUF2975 domain-containing protein n=1 Tax=Deinococcus budaensis TaxID=1665626 RepID=A0A7W8GGB0_9DEIO|nr:hypothetical protein [Deinococcus budaensis]MBB5235092.1 hypothetical protein [Deinococcus budaensis]